MYTIVYKHLPTDRIYKPAFSLIDVASDFLDALAINQDYEILEVI